MSQLQQSAPTGPGSESPAPSVRQLTFQWAGGPAIPVLSVLIALSLGGLFVLASGNSPVAAYAALFQGAFGSPYDVTETIVSTVPLVLTALSVAIAFRTGLFNIGAQGQLLVGALAAGWAGAQFAALPGPILMPIVVVFGIGGGAFYGGIVGVLKALRGVNEVITTIMLNYTIVFVMHWLLQAGPMTAQNALGTPASTPIGAGARLPVIIPNEVVLFSRLHAGVILAAIAVVFFWFLLWRTPLGYRLRAVGLGARAAAQAGIDPRRHIILVMAIAGGFAGLGGMIEVTGLFGRVYDGFASSYGFDAIAVALLGKNSPLGIVAAALLFGAFVHGGAYMQSHAGISSNLVSIIQAFVLFVIAAEALVRAIVGRRRHRKPVEAIA